MTPASVPERPSPPSPDLLLRAVAHLLRPLVRLLIRGGVGFPALADLLRALYVETAREMLPGPQAQTDSRLSLMTGVHRKEIRRQRSLPPQAEPLALTVSSRVIARWLATPALTGPDGRPLPLPRAGAAPSFEALVAGVTKDVRPRALLDEWLHAGVAALDAEGQVHLAQAAFTPRGDGEQQLFFFGRNLHDHVAAAAANVTFAEAPFLDRSVHYDGLSAAAAARLEAEARAAAEAVLLDVNRRALAIADADDAAAVEGEARRHRVNLGLYLFTAEEEPPGADG